MEVLLLLSGLLCFVIVTSRDVCDRYDVNGCSTPLRLPFFYKRTFTPACNRHDVCYRCAYRHGISRSRCDDVFHQQMREICNKQGRFKRGICRFFAKGYYKVVRRFGYKRYRYPSSWYCNQTWVTSCLPSSY